MTAVRKNTEKKGGRYAIHLSSSSDCALAVGNDFVTYDQRVYSRPASYRHYHDSGAHDNWTEAGLTVTYF